MPNRSRLQGSDHLAPPQYGRGGRPPLRRLGEDLISGLPDEVLHCILVRLRSARAAARTGVLSRRWRRVWAHLPELHLDGGLEALPPAPAVASFPDAVDGALAGCLAPALERLSIAASADDGGLGIPAAGRAAPWLRFAAGRVAGELRLVVPWRLESPLPEGSEIELPLCQRAKTIELCLRYDWWLRLPPAGLFTSLTALKIHDCGLDGSELTTLVCTQCPHLSALSLNVTLVAAANVSIRSDSLHSLSILVMNTLRLEVVAPRLEELALSCPHQAHISAPKLAKLGWRVGDYDPRNQRFVDVGRRLLLLEIGRLCRVASLLQQIDEVDILKLDFFIPGILGYRNCLDDTKILPKCKTLSVSILWGHHGLPPIIPHLLRSCNSTAKFSLTLSPHESKVCPWRLSCPCRLEENHRFDAIDLGSLEEVEISSSEFSHHELEFVELLSRCNATFLKKLVINYNVIGTPETKELCEKVRSMCPPNVELELYLFPDGPDGRRVRFN